MFKLVPATPDFPELENNILEFWAREDIFEAVRSKNRGGPKWSFQDGPITANNPMGVHHAWGRTYKDLFQRYHAMNGCELRYQNGFDCQGLWVEVEVEKQLGFETKRDIIEFGIDRFVDRCKQRVLVFAAKQTEQSIRLGYWMDWDDPDVLRDLAHSIGEGAGQVSVEVTSGATLSGSAAEVVGRLGGPEAGGSYFTLSDENNYTIWSFLKKCHEQGFLYQGTDIMPWCHRCGTGLSQMEVAEGRKITRHTSVLVRFPLRHREREALLVWTTTPWTLTSNVAVAVHPEATYLRIAHGDWILYLGEGNFESGRTQDLEAEGLREKHTLPSLSAVLKGAGTLEILGKVRGKDLLGLTYYGPFDHLPAQQAKAPGSANPLLQLSPVEAHRVIEWDEVTQTEGTGVVHIAPGCGAEDRALGEKSNLPMLCPLDEQGVFVDGYGSWSGRHFLTMVEDLASDLEKRGLLVASEEYPHVYPHCWRCKEELVFRLVSEWFIDMSWRERIQNVVSDIQWIPEDGEARERDWLRNMGNWMISKKRFWGLALPIWVCEDCEEFDVVGSRDELEKRAVQGWESFEGNSPHRPWIDAVKIECRLCQGLCHRIEDVGNPWLDAGIVPYSTLHYNLLPDSWREWFPADFVVECFPGQFRNWFYALLAMSTMMTGKAPFTVLLGHGLVRDERGQEMHKSSGNAIAFDTAAEALGAEVMRYVYAGQNPRQNLNFPDLPKDGVVQPGGLASQVRRKLLTWWNCYKFFVARAEACGWKPGAHETHVALSELDRWILSRLQSLIEDARSGFESFSVHRFMASFELFLDELSNWYLRRSRRRFFVSQGTDCHTVHETLYKVLCTLNRLMAPILPFLSEAIYQNLVRSHDRSASASVHLLAYPSVDEKLVDKEIEAKMEILLKFKNTALALRNQTNIKIRQPLAAVWVFPSSAQERLVLEDPRFSSQLLDECNIKRLEFASEISDLARFSARPNFRTLGPLFGEKMPEIESQLELAEPISATSGARVQLDGETVEISPEDLIVEIESNDYFNLQFENGTLVALDTRITPDLHQEGIARDFNRCLQRERRAMGLEFDELVDIRYSAPESIVDAIDKHSEWLCESLKCRTLMLSSPGAPEWIEIGGLRIAFEIESLQASRTRSQT